MVNPTFYILTGMSFAGKSVLARAINRYTGAAIIDPDAVGRELGMGLSGEFLSEGQWQVIHSEAESRAKTLLKEGQSLVYDTTAFNKAQRDALCNLAHRCDARPVVIAVKINREEAFRRWQKNSETHERFPVQLEDFTMCAEAFEFPYNEPHLLYKAGQDVEAWVSSNLSLGTEL